jgi:hypothetical protein
VTEEWAYYVTVLFCDSPLQTFDVCLLFQKDRGVQGPGSCEHGVVEGTCEREKYVQINHIFHNIEPVNLSTCLTLHRMRRNG